MAYVRINNKVVEYDEATQAPYFIDTYGFVTTSGELKILPICPNTETYKAIKNDEGVYTWQLDETKLVIITRASQKELIQTAYNLVIDSGFEYEGNTFDCDNTTLAIIGSRLALANSKSKLSDNDLTFYNRDKLAIVFSKQSDFACFCEEFVGYRNELDQKRLDYKKEINEDETVAEITAIAWS